MSPIRLAGHSFEFPLLTLEQACQVIRILELPAVDVGALKGYAHIDPDEIEAAPMKVAERIKRAAGSCDLAISDFFPSFGQGFSHRPINDPSPEIRARNKERFKSFVTVARAIGSGGITLLPGVTHAPLGVESSLDLAVSAFQEYVPLARDAGLRLSFEGHLGSVVDTPMLSLELARRVPVLSITLDYSHFVMQGYPEEDIHPLITHSGHVHYRQARKGRVQEGAALGTLDFAGITRRLRESTFHGYIAIEYTWQDWESCKNVDILSETILMRDRIRPLLS